MAKQLELLVPPPLVLFATAILMWLVAMFTTFARIEIPSRTLIGAVLFATGVLIDLVGLLQFRRAGTTFNPIKVDTTSRLVTTGLYRLSRNPMYVGQLLIVVAWAVYLQNVLSMFLVPVFILWIELFQIVPEERVLETKFGETFRRYARDVRRWI